jgi:hypothetical protein
MKQEHELDLFSRFKSEFCDKDGFVKPVNADAICNWFAWNVWREKVTTQVEYVRCPECDTEQDARVEHTVPFFTYLHTCVSCGYLIMESEWHKINHPANQQVTK